MLATATLTLALLLQSPPKPAPTVSAKRQQEIQRTIELKNALKTRKKVQKSNAAMLKAYEATEAQKEAERLAPLIRAEQEHQSQLMFNASAANSLNQLGNAALIEAETDRLRYRLQSQKAGAPQILTPQGFLPYSGGIAPYSR